MKEIIWGDVALTPTTEQLDKINARRAELLAELAALDGESGTLTIHTDADSIEWFEESDYSAQPVVDAWEPSDEWDAS